MLKQLKINLYLHTQNINLQVPDTPFEYSTLKNTYNSHFP